MSEICRRVNTVNSDKLVSVIVPVFNAEPFIDQCMESLVNQTYRDLEILVLDDGSQDGSLSILRAWQEKDPRIVVYSRENRGLIATLNELIAQCRGRYIARMDADDYCDIDRIRLQVQALDSDLALIGSNCLVIDENSNIVGRFNYERKHRNLVIDGFFRAQFCHPSVIFDMSKIDRADLWYDSRFHHAEDLELWLRLLSKYTGANLNRDLVYIRRGHATNISAVHAKKQMQNAIRAVQEHAGFVATSDDLLILRQRDAMLSFLGSGFRVGLKVGKRSLKLGYSFYRKLALIYLVTIARRFLPTPNVS